MVVEAPESLIISTKVTSSSHVGVVYQSPAHSGPTFRDTQLRLPSLLSKENKLVSSSTPSLLTSFPTIPPNTTNVLTPLTSHTYRNYSDERVIATARLQTQSLMNI